MNYLATIVLCILAAIGYGVVHDQITARICVEYFTIGHPPVFHTSDPTLLGLGWGIIATWRVGLFQGIPLAVCAHAGKRLQRSTRSLIRPIACLLGIMACCASIAGVMGFLAAKTHQVFLLEPLASDVPQDRHVAFLTDLWIHNASYLGGFIGGIVLCAMVSRSRSVTAVRSESKA